MVPRTEAEAVGTLERFGPLGAENLRRQLGRSAVLRANLSAPRPNRREVLIYSSAGRRQRGGPAIGEALAQRAAITCSLRYLGAGRSAYVRGRCRWGNDGRQSQCWFDWKHGTVVHPVGSSFELYAELTSPVVNGVPQAPDVDVEVGAHIGYGGSSSGFAATLTSFVATNVTERIPPFAQRLAVYGNPVANIALNWLQGATLVVSANAIPITSQGATWFAVPGGGVTALQTSATVRVWELAI